MNEKTSQQQYITTMRSMTMTTRRTTTMTMMRMMMTVPDTHFLTAHIMIWMSLPKKEIKHPLGMKLAGR